MATYVPDADGEWIAAVRGTTILFARADSSREVLALWPELVHPDPAEAVLDHVTAGGVSATPQFALVVVDPASASTRVVVRGPISVRVGAEQVDGTGVTTWTERVVVGGGEVVVSGGGASGGAAFDSRVRHEGFPVIEGIVTAREVRSGGVEPVAARPAASEPASAPAPAPTEPAASFDDRTVARTAAPEQTMVPDEETIVGVSVPVRPFAAAAGPASPRTAPATERVAASPFIIGTPPAAVQSASAGPSAAPAAPAAPALPGDHDGLTIASDDIQRLREARSATGPVTGEHAVPDSGALEEVALRMPDGSIEPVVDAVVLGRAPAIGKLSGGRVPRLVVIGAGDPDISRSHVRVAVEGGTVVVTDLDSRNGTHVVAPGRAPVKLRPADPTPVLTDTVLDLGGGWSVQVVTR